MANRILKWVLFLGLMMLVVARTFVSGLVYPETNILFLLWVIFLWFVWFLRSVLVGEWVIRRIPFGILHWIFLLGLWVSWFDSFNRYEGISFIVSILTAMMTGVLVIHVIQSESQMKGFIGVLLVTGAVVSLYGIYQSLFGLAETRQWVQSNLQVEALSPSFRQRLTSPRIFSTFIYPNTLAGYLLMLMPLSFAAIVLSKRFYARVAFYSGVVGVLMFLFFEKGSWVLGVIALAAVYPLLYLVTFALTLSKGGIIVFYLLQLVSLAVLYQWIPQRVRKIYVGLFFAVELGIVLFVFLNLGEIASRLWPSLKVRLEYWTSAREMICDFPVFGLGPNTFGSVYGRYKLAAAEETRMAHQNFLQVAAENGLLTGIIFLAIVLVPLVRGLWMIHAKGSSFQNAVHLSALLGILAFFLHSFTDFDLYEPAIVLYLWIFIALFYISKPGVAVWRMIKIERPFKKIIFILVGQALAIFSILGLRIPYQAECFFKEGLKTYAQGDLKKASTLVDQSLRLNAMNPHAHFLKGSMLEALGKTDAALSSFEEAERRDPLNPAFPYRKALVLKQLSQLHERDYSYEVEVSLLKAVHNYPTHPFYKRELDQYLSQRNPHNESIGRKRDALIY